MEILRQRLESLEKSKSIVVYENVNKDYQLNDYLLSVTEVSERLKTNKNFVYELINKGVLKYLIMGRKKVRNSEINRFLVEYEGKDLTD